MECILRTYPKTRELLSYPFRFTPNDFNKYRELLNNGTLQDDYEKWKIGINYKTNKKITINGKMHNSLKNVFMIKCDKGCTVLFYWFESSKYGVPIVANRIHKENDCLGEIIEYYEGCSCSSCENWNGCNRGGGTHHYECNKCSYKTQTNSMRDTRNYKGK